MSSGRTRTCSDSFRRSAIRTIFSGGVIAAEMS